MNQDSTPSTNNETKPYGVIYKVTSIINSKVYIGQTVQELKLRKRGHLHSSSVFGRAIKKYGQDNFTWEIIDEASSKEELNEKEVFYIKLYKSLFNENGYNVKIGGSPCWSLEAFSEEEKKKVFKKISLAHTGKKNSLIHNKHISESKSGEKNPMFLHKGEKDYRSKKILCINLKTQEEKIIIGIQEAGRQLNISASKICAVLKKRRKTCYGYTFRYIEN